MVFLRKSIFYNQLPKRLLALLGAKHFCGEEIAACGVVFARQTPEIVLAVL